MAKRILYLTKKQKENIKNIDILNQHIPKILQNKISNLKNLNYKNILINFITHYKDKSFNTVKDEYELIFNYISQINNLLLGPSFDAIIKRNMKVALLQTELDEKVKERFIHPFQNFLIGSLILDEFYNKFNEWFENDLEGNISKIETGWFLTSIFHDVFKTYQTLLDANEEDEPITTLTIRNEEKYIASMASLYEHLRIENSLKTWKNNLTMINNTVQDMLQFYANHNDHAVKSSILLLRDLERVFKDNLYNQVFIQAAISISIHHSHIYNKLREKGLMPLDIRKFPLACILLYCDAIHEWNRDIVINPNTELVDIKISHNEVVFEVLYNDTDAVKLKITEIQCINECILSHDDIQFLFSPRIRASKKG